MTDPVIARMFYEFPQICETEASPPPPQRRLCNVVPSPNANRLQQAMDIINHCETPGANQGTTDPTPTSQPRRNSFNRSFQDATSGGSTRRRSLTEEVSSRQAPGALSLAERKEVSALALADKMQVVEDLRLAKKREEERLAKDMTTPRSNGGGGGMSPEVPQSSSSSEFTAAGIRLAGLSKHELETVTFAMAILSRENPGNAIFTGILNELGKY